MWRLAGGAVGDGVGGVHQLRAGGGGGVQGWAEGRVCVCVRVLSEWGGCVGGPETLLPRGTGSRPTGNGVLGCSETLCTTLMITD